MRNGTRPPRSRARLGHGLLRARSAILPARPEPRPALRGRYNPRVFRSVEVFGRVARITRIAPAPAVSVFYTLGLERISCQLRTRTRVRAWPPAAFRRTARPRAELAPQPTTAATGPCS